MIKVKFEVVLLVFIVSLKVESITYIIAMFKAK